MTGPLEGIRVVDLTAVVSGPMATTILGDQGAEVIKVEPPGGGDLLRHLGTSRGGLSGIFTTLNRNKRSIALNLRAARGREILERLVARADVFVQNYRPGVVDRIGIGEPALRRVKPDLVYVSISGFGETGPYAQNRVYDNVIQALSGMASVQSDRETGRPALVSHIVCDKASALAAAQAITAALFARERGAGGQHVRLAMLDTAIAFLWPDAMDRHTFIGDGAVDSPAFARSYHIRATKDGFMTLLPISDVEFAGMCRALGRDDLALDPRFCDKSARFRNGPALSEIIDAETAKLTTRELCARLEAHDVPHAPVNDVATLHEDPQVLANHLLVEMDHPHAGRLRFPRSPAHFDATPTSVRRHAPALGEHTDEVLSEFGFGTDEIESLRNDGTIG
jgi:crotonobetainyl-CoA:carnitine CoA-transferase CaiB-like acyl-CoA transferase